MSDSLEDEIQDRFVVDSDSVIESNLNRVDGLFELYEDGTIVIEESYRDLEPHVMILIYFIGQRFAEVGDISEGDILTTQFFYEKIDKGERRIREYLQDLREDGLLLKEGQSSNRLVTENLPDALTRIEAAKEVDDS